MPLQDFHVIAKLGSGVYSSVYKVRRVLDGQFYALKKVKLASLNQKEKQNALNEAILLASIHHPNIIGYREALIDEESACLCLIMEYAQEGDLMSKITKAKQNKEPFQQDFIWKVLISVLNGLKRLNQKKIVHRDLKSANIFITEKGAIKIGDLNVSKMVQEGLCFTQTGTPYYASPQIWKDQPYGSKSDIWSLGCVIYELACLKLPFLGDDMEDLYKSVTKGIYNRAPKTYSTDLNDILRMMLQVDPLIRPSAERILTSSIVKKKLKESAQFMLLIGGDDLNDQNPEVVTEKHFIKKNIYQLGHHLPEPNYNRARVKTLHEPMERERERKIRSRVQLSKESYVFDYSPPTKAKKSLLKQLKNKQDSTLFSSKKAAVKILSKRNNIIELARKQMINLQTPKLKQIRQRLQRESNPIKSPDQIYMKKMIKNRTKTDTAVLLRKIMQMREKEPFVSNKIRSDQNQFSKNN